MQEPKYPFPYGIAIRKHVGAAWIDDDIFSPPKPMEQTPPIPFNPPVPPAPVAVPTSNNFLSDFANSLAMSAKYPKYYKDVSHLREIDVYAVHQLFNVEDPSGAIQHASKKLLLSGVRTGGKTKFDDIREARDTLNRWLEINQQK